MPVSSAALLQTSPEEAALGAVKCSDVWSSQAPCPASPAAPRHQLAGAAHDCYVLTRHHAAQNIAFSKDWLFLWRVVIFNVEVKLTSGSSL